MSTAMQQAPDAVATGLAAAARGLPGDASVSAYRAACAANHPDRIAGTGLAKDYVDMANARMARINDAYRRILKQYEATAS